MMPRILACVLLAAGAAPAGAFDNIRFADPPIVVEGASRLAAAASSGERIYAVDEKKGELLIFDANGVQLKTVSKDGQTPLLSGPQGVAVGPDGEVYVADTRASRIQVFSPDGKFLRTIGTRGSRAGQLSKPRSVAVGVDGRVYVSDTGNDRVQAFTREGIFLFGFGSKGAEKGQFKKPSRIEVTLSDHIYVLDEGNDRLQKFNPDTSVAREFKLHGMDFAVDPYGFIYMLDAKRGKVRELGPDGLLVGNFGVTGKGTGQFKKPMGIAVDPDGTILVADTGNKRLQRIHITNKLKQEKLHHNLATKLTVTGPSKKYDIEAGPLAKREGRLIAYLPRERKFAVFSPEGKEEVRFNGRNEAEAKGVEGMAAAGKYGIYAADTRDNKVMLYGFDGVHKLNFGEKDGIFSSKKKEGNVNAPRGVAINEKGTIYVADTGNRRVDAFSPDGTFLFSFGPQIGPHEFDQPTDLAWDDAGFIYVVDKGLRKIFKCEPSGGFIKAWGSFGDGVAQFDDPVSIAYDGRSYLYVLDRSYRRVVVFNRDGDWVTNFFAPGGDERSLSKPESLIVMGDELVVSDPGGKRVLSFELHPRLAPPPSLSTKAVEGRVTVAWEGRKDPWISRYRLYRSSSAWGAYTEMAKSDKHSAGDSEVEAYQKYFYRVAVEATTGDVGPMSLPVEVFIPGAFNQAPVEISTVAIGNIFSANYKWYLTNPLGKAVVVNNLNLPFKNVKVSFRLKDFMDFATEKIVETLEPKQIVEVPLAATLNNRILEVSEDTPIQAEVSLTYFEKGGKQEVSLALPLKVYSRNAITWEDPRRIANYITQNDDPVRDMTDAILVESIAAPAGTEYLNKNLATAMRLWSALGALGFKYLPSPNNPFEKISEDPNFPVDYTQFPRDTLRRKSGECDDLVTLTASMLERATVKTAVLDYPGHLALMFDTGSNDPMEIGLPKEKMVEYEGSYWIPLEATMVGSSFEEAARKALHAYNEMKAGGEATVTDPRKAWLVYAPATLPPSDQKPHPLAGSDFEKRFGKEAEGYLKERYEFVRAHLNERAKEEGESVELLNLLGILEVQHGKGTEAKKRFEEVLAMEPDNAAALNNLGNLAYVEKRYDEALARYEKASSADPEDAGVWANLTRAALMLGKKDEAASFAAKASALDKDLAPGLESLLKP